MKAGGGRRPVNMRVERGREIGKKKRGGEKRGGKGEEKKVNLM